MVLCAAFYLRVAHLGFQSLWRDEVDVILFAGRPLSELIGRLTLTGENGPLYYLLMHFWLPLTGGSETALRFPAVVGGMVGVAATIRLGELFATRPAAAVAGLLAALSPFLVWYSTDAKMYGLYFGLTALEFLVGSRALRTGRGRYWLAWLGMTVAGLYLHIFSILACVALAVSAPLLATPKQLRNRWLLIVAIIAASGYAPLLAWQVQVLAAPPASAYPFLHPAALAAAIVFSLAPPGAVLAAAVALTCGILAFLFAGAGRRPVAVLVWLLLPPAAYFLISLRLPVFTERYLIFLAVPFFVLLGAGAALVGRRSQPLALCAVGVMSGAFLFTTAVQSTTVLKSDFRSAARFVAARSAPDDVMVFLTPHIEPTFRYYYGNANRTVFTPYANDAGLPAAEMTLQESLAGAPRVWLVQSEPELHDAQGFTVSWLDRHFRAAERASFVQVSATLYER